ncbi:MAG: DUF554 domain-containing protein [Coriobacteriales bacterium]|jgi:uncharacterized membrane protein YqgA involved in biofilm formation|nr:DUF554 domain-containing protein [Coriobacteriales bacterium]
MIGVFANVITVLIGTALGLLFGKLIPERFRQIVFYAIGACTIGFGAIIAVGGFTDLSATQVGKLAAIVLVVSLVGGALIGELLRIEDGLEALGGLMHRLTQRKGLTETKGSTKKVSAKTSKNEAAGLFSEGFVTASVLFCAGAMTILGSIQAGLGDPSTLYLKATLDGVSAIALSTALGIGVGFAAATVLIVQGGLALLAGLLGDAITPAMIASIEVVGGVMLIALGIEILGIKKLKVGNMIPALLIALILGALLG